MAGQKRAAVPVPGVKKIKALHGALEHSLTIQRARLQEIVDEYVGRGALSRADADRLVGQLINTSRDYSRALLEVLDSLATETRKGVASRLAPVTATASDVAGRLGRAAGVPRMRAQAEPADPVPGYDALTVAQIKPLLVGLDPADLRHLRAREAAGKARKGVLGEIDRLLKS